MRCVLDLDWHHRDMLQCVDSILPSTVRGLQFQQVLAINLAIQLIDKQKDEDEVDSSGNDEKILQEDDGKKMDKEKEKEYKLRLDYPIKVCVFFWLF